MKEAHLVLCFDGTAQRADQEIKSNAWKIFQCAYSAPDHPSISQEVHYFEGVGSGERTMLQRGINQWGGFGVKGQFMRSYVRMCDFAAAHPDDEIKVSMLGFSRGFFTALMLRKAKHKVGLLDFNKIADHRGKESLDDREKLQLVNEVWKLYHNDLKPSDPDMMAYRADNSFPNSLDFYLYAFDPVGKFMKYKIVRDETGEEFTLHDPKLPRGTKAYIELLAQDEYRNAFTVIPVNTPEHYGIIRESIVMPGDHCCIGGSNSVKREPLADVAALEMIRQMQKHSGLRICLKKCDELFQPDEFACLDGNFTDLCFKDTASHWLTSIWNGAGQRSFEKDVSYHPSIQRRQAEFRRLQVYDEVETDILPAMIVQMST